MINCPNCESGNVQSYQVAFESGLSDVNTKSSGFSFGGAGLNFGSGKTKGTSQTAMSQKTAPPRKFSYIRPFIIGLIVAFVTSFFIREPAFLPNIVFVAVTGGLVYRAYSFNSKQWPELRQAWEKSFICHKCGHSFILNN